MIISVYGIARPEEQASLVAGGGSGKCRDPLWRIGHYFSRVKAHAITTPIRVAHRLPHPTHIVSSPILSKNGHRVSTRHTSRREHAINTSDTSVCWSVRSWKLYDDTYSVRRLPKSGRNTNQFSKSTSDTRVVIRKIPLICLSLCDCHLLRCSCYIDRALLYTIFVYDSTP